MPLRSPGEDCAGPARILGGEAPEQLGGVLGGRVTIQATITEGEDYDLIDHYLGRSIAERALICNEFVPHDRVWLRRLVQILSNGGEASGQDGVRDGYRGALPRDSRTFSVMSTCGRALNQC